MRPFLKESIALFGWVCLCSCEHVVNTKAYFMAFRMIFTFRVQSYETSVSRANFEAVNRAKRAVFSYIQSI